METLEFKNITITNPKRCNISEGVVMMFNDKFIFYRLSGKQVLGYTQVQTAECAKYPLDISFLVWDNWKKVKNEDLKNISGILIQKY